MIRLSCRKIISAEVWPWIALSGGHSGGRETSQEVVSRV